VATHQPRPRRSCTSTAVLPVEYSTEVSPLLSAVHRGSPACSAPQQHGAGAMTSLCKQGLGLRALLARASRQLNLTVSLSFSLIRDRSAGFMICCHAIIAASAVWSELDRPADGKLGNRVRFTPSRVRIPHPPPLPPVATPLTLIHVPSPRWALVSVLVSVGSESGCSVTQMRPPIRAATSRRMGSVTC
jgi:hypothetical protein